MKNILYLVDALTTGGAQTAMFNVIDNLDRTAYRPQVLILFADGRVGDALREKGVEVECLEMERPFSLGTFRRYYPHLRKLVRERRIDLIHSFLTASGIYGGLVARGAGIPSVLNVHSVLTKAGLAGRRWTKYLELTARTLNKILIAGNQLALGELRRMRLWRDEANLWMIYNGIDPAGEGRAAIFSGAEIRLTTVANFFPEKDHITLIKGYEALRDKYPLRLTIVAEGDTPHKKMVMDYVESRGLTEIEFRKTRLADTYTHRTDIFVLTSHSEGDPIVLKEAMSVGVPVVASKVGAVDEVIEDGVDGIAIGDGDLEGLKAALVRLIEDGEFRARLAANAVAKYQSKFALDAMRREYDRLYAYCLDGTAVQ